MRETVTEYGKEITTEDDLTLVYQFSPKAEFEKSEVKLLQVIGVERIINKPEIELTAKTLNNFRNDILKHEANKQESIFSIPANFGKP